MTEEKLNKLLDRTATFHTAVQRHIQSLSPASEIRFITAFQSGLLSLEHAVSALLLFKQGLFSSAIALTRPQFESLVRGIWLLHAASDNWVHKLSEPLTMENARRANEGEGLAEMLKQLEANPTAPLGIVTQLREYKEVTWKAMNSYAHGGLHPLSRRKISGYPPQLVYDVIRNSTAWDFFIIVLKMFLDFSSLEVLFPIKRIYQGNKVNFSYETIGNKKVILK